MTNIVLGKGLLGSEIIKQTGWDCLSRKEHNFDFAIFSSYARWLVNYNTIINCIGYTDTYSQDMLPHWLVNYKAVIQLNNYCSHMGKKLVHISTDYVYSGSISNAKETDVPVHAGNWYSLTKLLADIYIQQNGVDYLIVRCSFKPNPFPYKKAITTQIGNFDYVDIIADLIIKLINKDAKGIYNVGTEKKSIYELAKITRPDVIPIDEILHASMPRDITMNLDKMKSFLGEK